MKKRLITTKYESPCGMLLIGSIDDKVCLCDWVEESHHARVINRLQRILDADVEEGRSDMIEKCITQLEEYFAGKREAFDLPLLFAGTDFQKRVWHHLQTIPFGKTVSYAEIAREIGMAKAVRAIANATGANALSIIVPCHRVIGSDRSLTGYAGGIAAKQFLLTHEKVI